MNFDDIIKRVEDNPYSALFYTPVIHKKAASFLFSRPFEIISVHKKDDLDYAFKIIHKLIRKGYYGYFLIKYEAGFLFEPKFSGLLNSDSQKLIQFFFFDEGQIDLLKSSKISVDEHQVIKFSISNFNLNNSKKQFVNEIQKIKEYIKAGDTYQVNYTVKGEFKFSGSYAHFLKTLLFNQSAGYFAFINNHEKFIISLSPELFLHQKGNKLCSKPMKGTQSRGYDLFSDSENEDKLKSEKNLAENVMIVDMIRNDLGKICKYGSVKVPALFKVEKYESLFQMTSKVQGKLNKKVQLRGVLENTFPCGSVTGAPKIRSMEIINEIENEQRGIYTGSIGLVTPAQIKQSVAIRTITIDNTSGKGVMGLGAGIVWDSVPGTEYDEVILKSKFLTEPMRYFEIFETIKFENGEIHFLDNHLARMKTAADFFLFRFSAKKIKKLIEKTISEIGPSQPKKIKLLLNKRGDVKIEVSDIASIDENVKVVLSKSKIDPTDKFRHFKTTNRKIYDSEYSKYKSKGFFEVFYLNIHENLVEGSRTNLFLRKDNHLYTPPLSSGALAGVYRKYFMESQSSVIEQNLSVEDLINADELFLTNAIIGRLKVHQLYLSPTEFINYK